MQPDRKADDRHIDAAPTEEKKRRERQQRQRRTYIGYAIGALLAIWLFQRFFPAPRAQQSSEITYSAFKQKLAAGEILTVVIGQSSLTGTLHDPTAKLPTDPATTPETTAMTTTVPFNSVFTVGEDPQLVAKLQAADVQVSFQTGASDDIMRASELARRMVTEYGMSEKLGSVRYAGQQLQYLGSAVQDDGQLSPARR